MPEQTNSLEGACKRFECKVIGFPRPSIRWYKDGENITTHRRYQFDYTPDGCIVLIIDKVAPSDQGVYECRAENSAGSAETSALLHVRGEVLGDYDDPISVHSMSFRLLDSQKRPLILEQKRHDSAELSEDSVIDIRSDIANTKLEINGELDQSVANLNDESLNVWTDSNIDNTKDNYDNRLAEALAEIGNTENPRSRHWTADSGITSLGSSFSSEPDININHDSMLEMQRYLHGNPDDSCKPFTEETLNDTGTFFTETSKTECVSDKTEKVLDQNLIDKEVVENPKMANCDIAVLAYEFYQEDDIGHHLCTSKQNHVDHIEANIDWEKVDDHDASILAGKYLFAHGRDAQASDDIHPLSEWEMTKQVDRSQLISAGQFEDQLKKVTEEVQKQTIVETESSEQTFIKDSQMKNTATEADDIDGNLISTLNGEINGHRAENDFVTAEKRQQYFTANLQEESKYENKSEHLESMLDLNKKDRATVMNNDDELIEHSVSSSVKTEEQKHCLSENMRFSKLKTEQSRHLDASDDNNEIIVTDHIYESASSSDELMVSADTDESFDLDIDRSEQTITKRSQQYRRPSAQDDLTSEMVDQLATKETLSGNDKGIWLDAEIKTENYNKLEEAIELSQSLSEKCNEKLKAVDKDQTTMEGTSEAKAHAALNELDNLGHGLAETEWSDDDAYDLDLDRSEQLMIKKSQQFRRPSAKDSLTSEIIDDLSATQKLTPSNDAMSIGSESCQMKCSNNSSHSDDNFDLDVDRKEEAILARRSSLRKHQTQEMDTANMELDTVQQINSRSSVEKNEVLELRENIKEPKDGCDNSIHDSHDVNTTKDKNISDSMSDGENLETGASQQQNMLSDSLDDKKRDGISIDEHKGIPKTAEQSPEISQTLLTGEIVVQKETDFNFETVENLTTHTDGNSKSKTVPFEKLSSAEKDEILKQISDVSLLNGRRNRQLKEKSDRYNVNSESTNENDVPTETENETDESNINETAVLISDVNDSEKIKQAAVIEKQISRTDENEDTMDRTEVDSLEMQDSDNYQTPTLTTVNEQNDNKTILHKKKCDEYRVDEIMLKPQRDHEPPDVEMLETSPVRNALVSAEATTLFEKLELGSAEYLYQAEQLSDEKAPSRTSIDNDDLEMLDDTKPEVPNIINSIENVSSKTDLKCQTEEVLAFQEENRPLLTETNLTEIDGMNLNKIEKAVSKEESNLIIQEISISNEAIIVETPDHKDNSIEDKTKMKSNREHVPIVNEQIEQQSSQDVADDLNMDVEETFSETKVEELELRQTVDQITKADVMDTLLDKPSDLAEQMNNENATHGFKKELGNDEVDADKSCNQSQDIVIKAPVLEPGANQDDIEEETLLIEKNEITQHDGTARSDERLKSNEKDAAEQTVLPETGKEKPDEVSQKTSKPKIQAKTEDITIDENEPITLEWMITGVSTSEVGIIKDGLKVQPNDRISIQSDSGRLSLHIDSALVEDAAVYSITDGNSNDAVEAILVEVTALEALGEKRDEDKTEPAFVVEPVVAKEDDGRRMSIKCSVSGFPQPDVTWYHHGQPLGTGEFWDVYSKDGYHYLANSGSEFLDSEEIVCRVENDLGYIQTVLQLKKEGGEITCKPVQKEALCPDLDETSPAGPRVELQLTETNTKGLLPYTVTAPHTDKDNKVTVNEGEIVQLLGTYDTQQWITRHTEKSSKICYVPKHLLQACVAADVSRKECKNVARNQITEQINKTTDNTELQTPDTQDTPSASTMPERRKIVPGSKLHGTQEDGKDRDQSPTDIESKLGFKENLDKKKDVSDHTLPEYEDGTSRPMFKKRLKTVVTRTGELCQMECIVRGTPLPKVLWLKNNRPLKESDGCQVIADEETNMLVFPEVGKDDVGVYTARAMNVNGSVMSSAELTLEDGRPIPYSETSESPMDLDFTTPSYFFQMSSCQVAEGRLARFDCRVVAYPRPEIVWMRDGKVVESEGRYQLLNVNNEIYSLLIQDVQMSDTGRYTCWARNKFGEAMTEAYLNVIALTEQEEEGDMAPKFLTRFYDQQTTEGMPTDFRCLIAGKPAPSVTWLLDDIELKDSSAVRQRQKDSMVSLEMKSPKVDQSGQYTCQLRNPLGEATCSAKLTVIEDRLHGRMLPKFLRKFDHLTIKDGEEAKFSCVVVGEPKADIVWMFDHKPIPDSNRRFIRKRDGDTYSLIVKTARLDDAGVITCKAVNDEGEVYCSANLHVRESKYGRETPERLGLKPEQKESKLGYVPTFTKRLQDVEVSEGSTAKFECKVMGIPEPEVTWMKDGRVIQPGGRYHMVQDGDTCYLQIDNVAPSDTGVYTCILSNNQGKSSSSAALKMEGVPPKDKYVPEKPLVDTYAKKERYTPDRKIEDTYTRKTRYTPERYLEDMYTKKGRYTPERYLEDTYAKKRYTPERYFEDTYAKQRYTPDRYDDTYAKKSRYAPDYLEDTYVKRYTPDRYSVPESYSQQTALKQPYLPSEMKTEAVPKIAYDKPMLLHKTDESVRLSWTPVSTHNLPADSRRVSYVVESRELPSSNWTKIGYNVPGSSYLVRNLRPDKEYEFRVRAQNQHGISEPTRPATLEKRIDDSRKYSDLPEMRAPPRLPTHRPIITDLGEEMVRLAWRPVETYKSKRIPPVSYQVEAKELPGKDWMPISTRLRDTTHYLSELEPDRDYLFRVRAENDFGVSEPTEPLWLPRARVFPGVPISRPQIVEIEPHKAKLSWARVDVPAFGLEEVPLTYMLEVEEPPKDWRTLARDLDDTEYIIEGLKPEHDYRFRVRAKTPTGVVSEPSPAVSLYTTLAQIRAPVDRLEVLDYEPDTRSVNLSWQRVEVPPYSSEEEPLMYMLEYQEPPLPDWRPLVTGIPTTRYRVMHLDPDRDYKFRVKALTPYGVSLPSPALPVTMRQPPTAIRHLPEEVTISEVEPDSLRLTWRRPMVDLVQPMSYQIEMMEPLVSDWRPVATRVTDTTYKVTGLKPTRDYQFRVIPYADTRALASTPVVGLTSSPVRPRLHLSEPKIREMGPESVQLSWQPAVLPLYQRSRTPIHYGVEMMELPSTTWVPVARRVPDTKYLVSGLKPDRDYKFRVTAETDLATSEPSLAAILHRKPAPVFPRDEPTIRDFTPSAIMLSWQPAVIPEGISLPVSTPVFYSVESQSPPGMGVWSTLYARHPTPSVKLSDLRPDLDYLVRVRAHYNDFVSEPTLPVYIPRRAAPPRIPHEEPYPVDIGSDSVKLQWRSADLPVHIMDYAPVTYRIEAQELPGGNWVTVARGIPHTDFKVTGLSPKNDYCFRIRAENDYGVSDPTRPVTVGRRAVGPTLPSDKPLMYDLGPGSVRLSWRPATVPSFAEPTSPVTYTIFVQELPFKTWRPHVKRVPQTWYHISGLSPDKEYNFRVQAENEFGTSKPTQAVYMPRITDLKRPISMPEIDDFDEDLTSVKLHWKPRAGPPFDMGRSKYLIESWEPVRREWFPVAKGIPDTSYQLSGLPAAQDHLFRVRLETEAAGLSEPSVPVSVSRFYPKRPVYRPQLYELDTDSVRLSWEPAFIPSGQTRRPIRYIVEMREIPDKAWSQIASDLLDTNYKIRGLRAKYDYEFRVRALIDGEASEPSMPVPLYRRPGIPKVRFDVPEVYDVEDHALSLRWNKVDVPAFSYDDEPLSFMIERQTLPGYQWEPVATNLTGTSYRVHDLQPYQDYAFRVRGVYPSGYTEPSPHVPVYRRPIRLSVPIARPEVWEEEPYSARLRWQRAYIPPYYSSVPLRYRIEMQEAGPTTSDWRPVATDVTTPDFTVNELSPRKDYNFRIRAEMENGDISEPTPPIQYYRSQLPMSKEPFTLAEYKPVDYEVTFANRTYVEHLTKFVPPRLPIDKPEMVVINPETVELAWKPARVPESIRHSSNLTYTIEVRTPPCFEWRELVSGLKGLNSAVKKLHPKIDYIFRIRAWNEYGCSEPSLPVSLYRPAQHEADASFEEDEAFEREWELRFGQQVPPKLPMDTPKIITQSPEALWFSWIPARIPAYATQTPITYIIEVKEPPETSWNRPVKGVVDCQYTYEGMNPTRDYHIRVRAETQFGLSEPTLPIIIKRGGGSRPGSRRSSLERDMKSDDVTLDTTVIDSLTSGVPPRMASNRPLSSNAQPTSLTLSWPAARVPAYVKNARTVYIIEKREPPGHLWSVLAKDITETKYDIRGLNAEQDYMFRVRAKNEFGTSEPTLPMTLYRERDDYVPQKIRSRSGSRDSIQALVSRRRRSSSFDFLRAESEELDAIVQDKIPTQPEYTSTPKWDTQYGVEGKKGKIVLQVRGYPLPTVHWYLNDEKLDYGDNYNAFVSPSGTVTLEIKLVTPDTIGTYKCFAENESGSAVKFVKYEFADPPTVLEPLRDLALMTRTSGRLTCRVDGFPSPSAKWMKDWHPVKDSSRIKVIHEAPDTYCLEITNALSSDTGLYACTMENTAGKVTMTARLVVEDQEPGPVEVELKKSNIEDAYHILEEIGRSKQGVIRRVIEKQTGESYAANFIFARNKAQKNFFMTEFEILRLLNQYDNILKLHDAFETERSLILVTELISGTDLLDKVIADGNWTEAQAADAVKKLLGILEILGSHNIQHLDIKPSNIYLCGPEGKDMKLMNFALSQQLVAEEEIIHNYGSIGYASPEQVGEDLITDRTDMWGVGVLAYILLSGESPFPGTNDFEILNKMKTCDWGFGEAFVSFSEEAKDFISKLLLKNPSDRLSVEDCLKHPWLKTTSDKKLHIEKLNSFYESDKQKREASKSFITANLQSFNKILHGASALYQPAMDQESGEIIFPDTEEYGDFLSEDAWYEWQLHFMDDPDTQSFPLDNKDFTVRESRHTAGEEDSQDDKKDAGLSMADSAIMFRNKIQTTSFVVGEDVTFTCTVISPNCPAVVTWYRDEQLLSEDTYRTEAKYSEETGEASLKLTNLKDYDAAVYKCVARNKDGRVSCEARLLLGDTPGKPGRPVITQTSGSEVFLTWTGPVSDGNSYILGYRIDFKKTGDEKWTRGPFVTEEYALVSGLAPSSEYIFRISCHNKYGAGQYSWASLLVTTGNVETPKIELAKYLRPLLKFSSYDKQQLILQAASRRPSLTVVADATSKEGKPEESYSVLETVSKGSYGEYKLCSSKANNKQYITKVMPFSKDNQDTVMYEFNILSRLRQVNIVTVFESFIDGDKFYVIFEKLSGINVVQYLCLRKFYSEDTVCRIVRQILDGLQYLQQVGIAHLNLQPSSVVMATKRRLHVKLRDFTLARKIENGKEEKVSLAGYPDFIAPEILRGEPAEFAADVWGLGVLAFVLLSGTSPFGGTDLQETLNKIVFDRYNTCDMYDNVSKEAISFVRKMLKRLPRNRTTVVKCLDSRWLQLTDSMTKTRNGHLFRTETLRDFLTLYTERKGDKQYMDMSVITGESLAKPMIGPATEPVLSKKIPKYAKPVIKSSQDTKSDLDSIETIASDFKSVLDKIDKLRTALESGSEIPEWETTTMKPGGFDTPKLVARKVTEEKLKDTIQTTEVDSTCLNTSESGGKVGILYETGKAEKSDSLVSKDYKLAKSAESSVAVETKSESSKAFETENKLDLTTKANENKAHKSDLEMNKDIESTAEKPETFKMSGENNDTKHEALEQLNQAATQNDASIEHVTVEKSGHNSVANSKAKIADEFFTVSGMDTEKEKQNTQFKGLKETSMKADEKVSDTEANTLSVNKMKIQKQKDENRSFPKQKTEEKIQTENDVASKHDSGSQHEDENKETRPKKLSGLKDKKQIPPKAVENIISTSTDTNPQLNEKSACETTDKELKVIPSHSAEVDKEHMKSSDKGGSNEAEHKKFIDQQQENTEINSKPQTESTAKTTESYKETQETKQDTAAGNNMETVVSKKSGSQQDLEKTNQKIIEEIKESVVKEQEKYEIDLKQKNESTVKTKEASNDMKEVEQKLVQKHAAADIIEESSESKKSDSQQVLSETNQKTVEEVIECVTRTQEMAEIDLKQKTVSNAQEEKALKEMQEVEQKTVKEHVAADIDKDTLSKKPDSKQVMSETDQGIKTMQKEQTEHNENSIKTEEVLEKRETVEQITVQDNMSDDINAEAAIGNTPYCQQAVSETNQEIVEEIVECVARKKDNAVPNMEILKQKENINGNLELNSEGKAEEEKISTKESQSKVVDKVENAKERVDIVDKEPMLTEHNIQETCPAEEIAEELIEAKVAKKDKALPNLDIKEKNNQKQDKTKEELFQADKSTDNKQSKISDESNFQCEFETDKVKPNTETGHQTILKENEISSVVSEGTHSNASTVGQNLSDSNSSEQTGLNAQELKDSNVNSSIEIPNELKNYCDSSKEHIISSNANEADRKKFEVTSDMIEESERCLNDLSEEDKRRSMSTISTVSESEYLDALSCSDHKDIKCIHESTPDSAYVTPDRDIPKPDPVVEEEANKNVEITEKSDTEPVKEREDNSAGLKDQEIGTNIGTTTDTVGVNTEKDLVSADVEQMAERLVLEAMDDALKVAEKTE